ncbi:MAG: hydantoinase B/oxoprolinase family protein, partial [Acidobacteriota bacterium]
PYGMEGGGSGKAGKQRLTRKSGEVKDLAGIDAVTIEAGDTLTIETPGGGGWGSDAECEEP